MGGGGGGGGWGGFVIIGKIGHEGEGEGPILFILGREAPPPPPPLFSLPRNAKKLGHTDRQTGPRIQRRRSRGGGGGCYYKGVEEEEEARHPDASSRQSGATRRWPRGHKSRRSTLIRHRCSY